MLTNALNAFQAGRFADALIAAEYVCRRHPENSVPAILRARILEACRPELAPKAWYRAWFCDPENPVLQDAMLRSWLAVGAAATVLELGPAFLPERCRGKSEATLLSFLEQAGLHCIGTCWKSGEYIEGVVYRLPLQAVPGNDKITLVVSDEISQFFYDVVAGERFKLACPRPDGVWSVAFSDDSEHGPRILQGSPIVFRAPNAADGANDAPSGVNAVAAPRKRARKTAAPIDIVIPVYREQALVKACLDSVLASLEQNETAAEIVVIDDAGPEPALSLWLDELAQQGRITLLRNRYNLGFIETVNRGLRLHPERDALLLNADTAVHGDWIDRLKQALYSAPDIASVTPWSNNGEITSFPKVADSVRAPSRTQLAQIDDTAAALHRAGLLQYIELPACCGFAMLMKRSAMDRIGLLDGAALVRGYGEEVDWCMRARAAGYRHLAATGVFVSHTGTVSFRFEKRLRVAQNRKILSERYPDYRPEYQSFLKRDPLANARRALRTELAHTCADWVDAVSDDVGGPGPVAAFVPAAAPSSCVRIGVWHLRQTDNDAAKVLELARLIASRRLPVRLLLIGEASEALWHTGVVDVLPSATETETNVLTDAAMLGLGACNAVLTSPERHPPLGLPCTAIDESFRPGVWLANWLKAYNESRKQNEQETLAA